MAGMDDLISVGGAVLPSVVSLAADLIQTWLRSSAADRAKIEAEAKVALEALAASRERIANEIKTRDAQTQAVIDAAKGDAP